MKQGIFYSTHIVNSTNFATKKKRSLNYLEENPIKLKNWKNTDSFHVKALS